MEETNDRETATASANSELPEVISREDLYALVWSEPMSRLSVRFGLSDVGLAKACARMLVPVPGRGYWAKKEVGRAPRPTRLPALPANAGASKRELHIRRREPPKAAEAAQEPVETIVVAVPEVLTQPHTLVAKTVKAFRRSQSQYDGFLVPKEKDCLAVHATMGCIDRAMRIFDALIKAFEERGHVVEVQRFSRPNYQDPQYRTVVLMDGESVEIELQETTRRVERVPKGPNDTYPKYEFVPSGQLSLVIKSEYGRGPKWTDSPKHPLELQLGRFIHGVARAALDIKETRRIQEERERERLAQQRREWEEDQRRRAEAGRIRALDADIDRMHAARWAREYLQELKDNLAEYPDANTVEMQAWVAWVEHYAKRIDPFSHPAAIPRDPKPYG